MVWRGARLVLGLVLAYFGAVGFWGAHGMVGLFFAMPLALLAAICLYPFITELAGDWVSNLIYGRSAGEPPEQFTRVRALLSANEDEAAAAALEQMLADKPDQAAGRALLVRVWYERLRRADQALALAREALTQLSWHDDYADVAMIGVDICLERGDPPAAVALLRLAIAKTSSKADRTALTERLHAIQPTTST